MYSNGFSLRVEFGDCDPAQIAYYPHFFQWFDRGTHRLFEAAGVSLRGLTDQGIAVPLVHVEADFVSPATWGDDLIVESRIGRLGARSLALAHTVKIRGSGDVVAKGSEIRAFVRVETAVERRITAIEIPPEVRRALERNALPDKADMTTARSS
jgi:4-hydroxybenzoyl-CoA thioesterase